MAENGRSESPERAAVFWAVFGLWEVIEEEPDLYRSAGTALIERRADRLTI